MRCRLNDVAALTWSLTLHMAQALCLSPPPTSFNYTLHFSLTAAKLDSLFSSQGMPECKTATLL